MLNQFDKEINNLRREVLALKQQKEKSASVLQTVTETITLSFDLELIMSQWLIPIVRSQNMAIIDFGTSDNPLVGVNYNITGLDDRIIRDVPYYDSATGHIGRMVYIYSNNQSDLSTLQGGGTVTLTYDVEISSTSELEISTSYEDLWVD